MHCNVLFLADISKEAPSGRPSAVESQAIAASYCYVHAIAAKSCMRERPVGGQIGRRQAQMDDSQVC